MPRFQCSQTMEEALGALLAVARIHIRTGTSITLTVRNAICKWNYFSASSIPSFFVSQASHKAVQYLLEWGGCTFLRVLVWDSHTEIIFFFFIERVLALLCA